MHQNAPITVFIVDDDKVIRLGLRLGLEQWFKVVGEAGDGETAVLKCLELQPEVVLMDVGLPVIDGMEACRRIKIELPTTAIVMVSSHNDPATISESIRAGADHFCVKDIDNSQLYEIIREVAGKNRLSLEYRQSVQG
ncbi:MAG: response regulator transcription factor [Candidatus Melainabacteria bacterium]|nr:response regulator transcription factor [Candidatus Melainabacteria bacterium]